MSRAAANIADTGAVDDLICEPLTELGGLAAALSGAMLPVDDLEWPGRSFFRYRTARGELAGYGGFELLGGDALLRSIVVLPTLRGRGLGGAILDDLMARVAASGATAAYLITETARGFFEQHGFGVIARADAPATILATAQAADICPATAPLMTRTVVGARSING